MKGYRGSLQALLNHDAVGVRCVRDPLIKSTVDCVAGKTRMDARRATKVVAWTTKPRRATKQTPHFCRNPEGRGLSGRSALSLGLPRGSGHWLRLASPIPSRKAAVATARDLIRGSLILRQAQDKLRPCFRAPQVYQAARWTAAVKGNVAANDSLLP